MLFDRNVRRDEKKNDELKIDDRVKSINAKKNYYKHSNRNTENERSFCCPTRSDYQGLKENLNKRNSNET